MIEVIFYGFNDRDDAKGYHKIVFWADKMDKNNFMFSNSP